MKRSLLILLFACVISNALTAFAKDSTLVVVEGKKIFKEDLLHDDKSLSRLNELARLRFVEYFGRTPEKQDAEIFGQVTMDFERQLISMKVREIIKEQIIQKYCDEFFTQNDENKLLLIRKEDAKANLPNKLILKEAFEYVGAARNIEEAQIKQDQAYDKFLKGINFSKELWRYLLSHPYHKDTLYKEIDQLSRSNITKEDKLNYIRSEFANLLLKMLSKENMQVDEYLKSSNLDGVTSDKFIDNFFYSEGEKMDIEIINKLYFSNLRELIYFLPFYDPVLKHIPKQIGELKSEPE